ncbi:MAG TPA: class I SAM-dependent methyltransferase [Solirubrobacterales bacterium]
MANAIDPTEFREGQRKQWDAAATGWDKWSEMMEGATEGVSQRLSELAEVKPGSRVLDVAAGYGAASLTAAGIAGPEGRVVATDISTEMLAFGRKHAADAGLDNMEFVESAAAALDFPDDSFDAAISRWGIIFDPDGEGAAARVRGFLVDGGRMAISSWGEPEQVPFLSIPMKTVMGVLGVEPPPPGTPGPLSRPTPEAIGGLLEGGGFADVETEQLEVEMEWESPEQFTTFVREIAPPIRAMMAGQPQERQDEAWNAITEAVREHAGGDGQVRMPGLVLLAAGRA